MISLDIEIATDILAAMNSKTEPTKRIRLSREDSQRQTRDRLLDAAAVLFVRDGYSGTSLRDIAAHAGYSQGAFYSNFQDKAEVLLALMRRQKEAERARATAMLAALTGTAESILGGLEAWTKTLDDSPTWCVLSVELQLQAARDPAFGVHYHALWETQLDGVAGIVDLLFSKLERTPPAPARQLAAHYMALIHGVALQRISTPADASMTTSAATMLFLRGLIALCDASRMP
jgi:AcrR family transcriptional regulator